MRKPIAAAAIAATTLGGVAAGATIMGPGLAGAQDDEPEAVSETVFADRLSEALQPLVDDGTITESQRDAVVDQLESSRPDFDGLGFHRHPGPGHRLEVATGLAEILGMEPDEMAEALRSGESLADLAEANGVDPQDLVDAMVTEVEERVDSALEADRIDEEKAAEILENATERAEDVVSGEAEPLSPRPGHHHRPHGHGLGDPGATDSDTDGEVEPASD
jgi:hypothetical protein